ncbi:MAG: hypothetical protein A3E87_09975 [Gammaproteobacteria bacterium RIFCSPHIGHO2_12_FULL_35_23]|nr:MAG: hypothetical protein A3E87_09975 [Gammaproteobacteria bacterium RIFCSPHIGHO2_12_FULL_35_23]
MKNIILSILLASSLTLGVGACSMQNQDVGAIVGGGTGAVAGNLLTGGSAAGTAVGAVAGGVGGYYIGKSTQNNN